MIHRKPFNPLGDAQLLSEAAQKRLREGLLHGPVWDKQISFMVWQDAHPLFAAGLAYLTFASPVHVWFLPGAAMATHKLTVAREACRVVDLFNEYHPSLLATTHSAEDRRFALHLGFTETERDGDITYLVREMK